LSSASSTAASPTPPASSSTTAARRGRGEAPARRSRFILSAASSGRPGWRLVLNMAARRTANPLPKTAALQLCTLVDEPFDDAGWIFEPKLDGLRVLARVEDGNIQLVSRNGKRQDGAFPDVVEGLRKALRGPALLDGEIVCLDEKGRSSFRLLQQRFHLEDHREIERRAAAYPAYLY